MKNPSDEFFFSIYNVCMLESVASIGHTCWSRSRSRLLHYNALCRPGAGTSGVWQLHSQDIPEAAGAILAAAIGETSAGGQLELTSDRPRI